MAPRYQTGEEIHRGDRVTYGGNAGLIELVVEALTGEPEEDWCLKPAELASWSQSRRCSGAFISTILMRRRISCSLPAQNDVCRTTADRPG
jgi:hypothetical protein